MTNKVHFFACCLMATSLCASAQFVPELGNAITSMQYTVTETEAYYLSDTDDPSEVHPLDWVYLENSSETKRITSWIENSGLEYSHISFTDSDGLYEDWMTPTKYMVVESETVVSYDENGNELSRFSLDSIVYSSITDYSAEYQQNPLSFLNASQINSLQAAGVAIQTYTDHYVMTWANKQITIYPNDLVLIEQEFDSTQTNVYSMLSKYTVLATGEYVLDMTASRTLDTLQNGQVAVRINNSYYSEYAFNMTSGKTNDVSYDFSLYPNPTTNQITLESEKEIKGIQIISIQGSKMNGNELFSGEHKASYDISHFPQGIYFVRIYHPDGNNSISKFYKID